MFPASCSGSKMASKTRVAVCLLFAIALLASSATATATSTLEGAHSLSVVGATGVLATIAKVAVIQQCRYLQYSLLAWPAMLIFNDMHNI